MGRNGWGRVATAVAGVAVATAAWAAPATAAKAPNPCKLLKTSEISQQFGGATVSAPEPGTKTPVTVECGWDVAAGPETPDGNVTARLMVVGAKPAYDGMKKMEGIDTVSGLKNTLYQPATGALMALTGDTLVTVQGVFLEGPPIKQVDVEDRLIPLLKLAQKRA